MAIHLDRLTIGDLLRLHGGIGAELKRRGLARTGNNPCADLAEYLAARAFGWTLNANSKAGFDAWTIGEGLGERIEIKARRLGRPNASRQASALRRFDDRPFDRLLGVVFDADYRVMLGVIVPYEVVARRLSHVAHTNSGKFYLRDDLRDEYGVEDVTAQLAQMAATVLAGL